MVLSACETGVGQVENGEGVYGLRRALVLAGAENQVASLWNVNDAATKDLMVDYYTRLSAGVGRFGGAARGPARDARGSRSPPPLLLGWVRHDWEPTAA